MTCQEGSLPQSAFHYNNTVHARFTNHMIMTMLTQLTSDCTTIKLHNCMLMFLFAYYVVGYLSVAMVPHWFRRVHS